MVEQMVAQRPSVRLPDDGRKRTVVDIIDGEQPWATVNLEGGNRLRIQVVIYQVLEIEGAKDEYGNQLYEVISGPLIRSFPPKAK